MSLFDGFLDGSDHIESLLRQPVVFAFQYLLEAAYGIFDLNISSGAAGKRLPVLRSPARGPAHRTAFPARRTGTPATPCRTGDPRAVAGRCRGLHGQPGNGVELF